MPTNGSPFQRRKPRQARSRATVETIVEAAAQILERQGPGGLTTNGVAERAGVSIGSVYQYFPDKQALLLAAARRELGREPSRRNALMAALIDWIERFGARPAAVGRMATRRPRRQTVRGQAAELLEQVASLIAPAPARLAPARLAPIRIRARR
jgi:AcrR family transcriptional regulator